MPYTSLSDVKALAPHVPISNTSQPDEATVRRWIADLEPSVDATLANIGYKVPIVAPQAVAIVRLMVANAIMAMVMRSRPNPESDPENFQRYYDTRMKALASSNDPFELPGAETLDAPKKAEGAYRFSSNLRDIAIDADHRISVTRDKKF